MNIRIRGWVQVLSVSIAVCTGGATWAVEASAAPASSTSPFPVAEAGASALEATASANRDDPSAISFDEFSLGTTITDQYSGNGVIFTSDVFLTTDTANPTSPVLSGTPRFFGDISGYFTVPGTATPATVDGFSLDVGYINDRNSVEITYYDAFGNQVGATRAQSYGINEISITYRGVASFKISAIEYEAAGFAIDNLVVQSGARGIHPTRMAELGDSYSSGEGLLPGRGLEYDCGTDLQEGRYVEGTNVPAGFPIWTRGSCRTPGGSRKQPKDFWRRDDRKYKNLCHRHARAYPNRIREKLGIRSKQAILVACSGAKTKHVLAEGQYPDSPYGVHGGEPQLTSVRNFAERRGEPDFITVGIGGNDAGFSGIIIHCIFLDCANTGYGSGVISRVNGSMYDEVKSTFVALAIAFPNATIAAFGYPSVIDDPDRTCAAGIKANEMAWLKYGLLPAVNEAVKDAARAAGIAYVDISSATAGHGICSEHPWINGFRGGDDRLIWNVPKGVANESFHPNQRAHVEIAKFFLDHYTDGNGSLLFTNPPREEPIRVLSGPEVRVGELEAGALQGCGKGCRQPVPCLQGCPIHIQGSNFEPGATLNVTLRSDPVALGQIVADANGEVTARFKAPRGLKPGLHSVSLEGVGPSGAVQDGVAAFQVFGRARPRLRTWLQRRRGRAVVRALTVKRAAPGTRVDIVCVRTARRSADRGLVGARVARGRGCPFVHRRFRLGKRKRGKAGKHGSSRRNFARLFKTPLAPRTTLRVVVSSSSRPGRSLEARIRRKGKVKLVRRCTRPGQRAPVRC